MASTRALTGVLGPAVGAALVAGCTTLPGPTPAPEPAPPAPVAPPAACLLDAPALGAATGVGWVPDLVRATDTRCVYESGEEFLAVDVVPGEQDVETPAELCDTGTRTDLPGGGLVCRFGDGVFAAAALPLGGALDDDSLVTVAAARVPTGTDAERLSDALADRLDALARG